MTTASIPAPENIVLDAVTKLQMGLVMLFTGTEAQKKEALQHLGEASQRGHVETNAPGFAHLRI